MPSSPSLSSSSESKLLLAPCESSFSSELKGEENDFKIFWKRSATNEKRRRERQGDREREREKGESTEGRIKETYYSGHLGHEEEEGRLPQSLLAAVLIGQKMTMSLVEWKQWSEMTRRER
jgi:hypothetical protein